jgi:hypothetical protein
VRREVVDCMRLLMKLAREKTSQVSLVCQCQGEEGEKRGAGLYEAPHEAGQGENITGQSIMSVSEGRKVRREMVDCMRLLVKLAREKTSQVSPLCQCQGEEGEERSGGLHEAPHEAGQRENVTGQSIMTVSGGGR